MIDVKNLSGDALSSTPVLMDWNEMGIEWESYEDVECPECGKTIVSGIQYAECPHCEDGVDTDAAGPMMNFFYPLPQEHEPEDAMKLEGLPLCLVNLYLDGSWGLALTGGGMDLSWEICEAFIRLGYTPPVHFASSLPIMAGLTLDERHQDILAACRESLEVQRVRTACGIESLNHVEEALKENGSKA